MRYIVGKKALEYLSIETKLTKDELAKPVIITDEPLHFKNIPFISAVLTKEQVKILRSQGIEVNEEKTKGEKLATDYEKIRSRYYKKAVPKGLTGRGCKIAVMDTGCVVAYCPVDFAVNFADANEGVAGQPHGHMVTSIIKSSIGMANGAEVHFLKVITDADDFFESAFLAAMDYCIEENIDIINMSFSFNTAAFDAAIATFIAGGGVVVAATGNDTFDNSMKSPAKLPDVVAINCITETGGAYCKNVLNPGGHGVTAACSGIECQVILTNGAPGVTGGTSYSAPFFVALFACYKQELNISDNQVILDHILSKCVKSNETYFGYGLPTF